MADDQNPQLPLGSNSDNPNGSDNTIKGPGAALRKSGSRKVCREIRSFLVCHWRLASIRSSV